eukprot:TRINITY_DN16016_c0_g1_i1.p1 TRINITY_DN16016_c0_g1~~TRINITY_DN16016_c0_g1_i1.p1  ORF type:complete len:249 (+),score=77.68 TRINITY_DN16016_c0_g1_i1:175-921(+)
MHDYASTACQAPQAQESSYAEVRSKTSRRMGMAQQMMQARCEEEDVCEDALDMVSAELELNVETEEQLAVEVASDLTEMEQLLVQLRREPSVEAEVAAKFELFEKYLETVSMTRDTLFEFWGGCSQEFNPAGQHAVQTSIDGLDCADALGVNFVEGRWFVYDMTKKAGDNNGRIARVLQDVKTKLDLMSEQGECPVCLEEFAEDVPAKVLGCCHKVCEECWDCWDQMHEGHGFCPLCRHDEFVENFIE